MERIKVLAAQPIPDPLKENALLQSIQAPLELLSRLAVGSLIPRRCQRHRRALLMGCSGISKTSCAPSKIATRR